MKTLGQILREAREKQNSSLEEAEIATKIRKSYLMDLEEGKYDHFPTATHIKGFLKIYADFLHLPHKQVFAFFRREFDESKDKRDSTKVPLSPVKEPFLRFSPQVFFSLIFVCAVAVLFAYIYVQYQSFAGAPQLDIYSPKEEYVSQQADLSVEGKVTPDSNLTLNGQSIGLAQDGYFKTTIQLSEGRNVLTFVAVNELGKPTTLKRTVRFDVVRK